jgi:GNAT superfamily N-acetyltransferase
LKWSRHTFMRIRHYRQVDLPTLIELQNKAVEADGIAAGSMPDLAAWVAEPERAESFDLFVITDDDDELNQWGSGETLEGVEGEIVGYTALQLQRNASAYHLLCQGTVHPSYRRQNAGRALLICALNHARILAAEFEFEAEEAGHPVYFEALLPVNDPASGSLAARCEMLPVEQGAVTGGLKLYRREL